MSPRRSASPDDWGAFCSVDVKLSPVSDVDVNNGVPQLDSHHSDTLASSVVIEEMDSGQISYEAKRSAWLWNGFGSVGAVGVP